MLFSIVQKIIILEIVQFQNICERTKSVQVLYMNPKTQNNMVRRIVQKGLEIL